MTVYYEIGGEFIKLVEVLRVVNKNEKKSEQNKKYL